ncbi:DNA gyrase subunit A [candidate division NPL-UPA2 bacterium]|nr:DNA gyrase subunit A [candidate division NPL-UPA2 bacterium]
MYTRNEKVTPVYIEDEMKSSYLDYAMSVIVGRALPDVRDGLKPVHRRILYAMQGLGLSSNKPYKKSARVVGEVLGKYHPHGDVAVYDALVRMAQDFCLRYPLIDGQGNFGSVDGDAPAAMRYTEVRLSPLSEELLADIDRETINFMPNFDDTLKEPTILPSRIPNLLINGSSGIAVGMATNIPPHNLGEIVEALVKLIDLPEVTVEKLIEIVPGPDFPTAALIFGREGIKEAYTNGKGIIKLRARTSIEKVKKRDRERIIITEIPYQINKSNLLETMASLVREKKIEGISDIRDESDKDGMRIVVELRRGEEPTIILNQLYKHTQLQTTVGVIMLALVDGRPRVLNLKQCLQLYLEHRKQVVRRRTEYDLKRAEIRAHILEGLKIALSRLDAVIKTIRESREVDQARGNLMKRFKLTQEQAQAILDMRLQRLTGLERKKINEEYLDLIKRIVKLQSILASEQQILNIIKDELLKVKEKYADRRRTEILDETTDFSVEDLIAEEDMVITISHANYIKRLPVSTYRQQQQGGKGVTGAGTKEEDFIEHLFIASTHQYILFFTNSGRVYWLKVYEVPQAGRLSKGKAIINLLRLSPEEKITAFVPVREFDASHFIVMVTERGIVKRTALAAYSHPRADGIIGLTLDKGDRLIEAKLTRGSEELVLATEQGKAIRFKEAEVRAVGRTARGVKGLKLEKKDRVVGMQVIDTAKQCPKGKEATLLSVTANGYGKRSLFSEYRTQSRGGKGVVNIKTTERNGSVVGIERVVDRDELMLISSQGRVIRIPIAPIRVLSRNTQGVRLIRLDKKDEVVGVARVVKEE